jgi:diaminopimelate decarboxylase
MKTALLSALAKEFGTPLYVYDEQKIITQYQQLKSAFGKRDVKLHYAMKALSNSAILKVLKKEGA